MRSPAASKFVDKSSLRLFVVIFGGAFASFDSFGTQGLVRTFI
jgi:hypothetical protein